jgi:ABC-type nitrate/sulfonate/bicarbonate transport system ATPase subunit
MEFHPNIGKPKEVSNQKLIVKNIDFAYEQRSILHNVSFEVKPGHIFLIQGDSGVGKSTLLKIIAGLLPVQRGSVIIPEGNIRILFQEPRLFPWFSVRGNLEYALRAIKYPPSKWEETITYWLDKVGLSTHISQPVQNLSGGMQQRLALARVMCSTPQILLLDEPFSSLHKELREELWNLLKDITSQENLFTILVSHHLEVDTEYNIFQL